MLTEPGGPFINVDKLDLRKYATRPALAKVLCDYIIYHDHNPKKALELAALATAHVEYKDWWWKVRLRNCRENSCVLLHASVFDSTHSPTL